MTNLRERIRAVLHMPHDRWHGGLAEQLANASWADLASIGIDRSSYGTCRVLQGRADAPRDGVMLHAVGWRRPILLERFDAQARERYRMVDLHEGPPPPPHAAASLLAEAMAYVDQAPQAGEAIRALVWSISVLAVDYIAYDVSHSDPAVPFSVFLGLHHPIGSTPAFRLAESLLHETMHLQLSLIENEVQLVRSAHHQAHSPWQRRPRPTQGLLHGLYVFRVIQDWLRACMAEGLHQSDEAHARRRITEIDEECAELALLWSSTDLTDDGRTLAKALSN